ncbi:MAG: hypothetical protein AAFX87_17690 [Bacteroidota bacterium]
MQRTLPFHSNLITFGIPVLLILSMVGLAYSSWFQSNPSELALGITFDLTLTIPIVYLILIWKKDIPKITAVPFYIAGLIVASYVIPTQHQQALSQIKQWVVPVVELGVFLFVVLKMRSLRIRFKAQQKTIPDFFSAMKEASMEILPGKVGSFFAMEISTFYYGFFNWKKPAIKANQFTYHKESGSVALLYVVMLLVVVETAIIHLLVEQWSDLAAWILTGISVYSGLQVFGMARSMDKRPISLEDDHIHLKYGILAEAAIQYDNIADVELSVKDLDEEDKSVRKLSPLGQLESHNVLIHLKEEDTIHGLYGMKKTCKTLALHVDDKDEFAKQLNELKG